MIETILALGILGCGSVTAAPTAEQIDRLAQARDVEGITSLVDGLPSPNPLQVLKTNGAYECGRYGWHAQELKSASDKNSYVVLFTPLTSEDIGDFVFKREGERLVLVPEDQALGVHIVSHNLDVTFDLATKSAKIKDQFKIDAKGDGDFIFRMSEEFRVKTISDSEGESLSFSQAGGVVLLPKPKSGIHTLSISYEAVVDHPLYSGSISLREASLTNCYWYPMVARQPAPYQVTVHYPKDWIAIGQGVRLSEEPGTTHFRMDLPCIFYSLSAGPYRKGTYSEGERTFYSWSPRLSVETLNAQAETYASIIKFYSRFAPFPFKGYGGLDSPAYGGGALEAYSYATYGGGFPTVDAHEPSHTWWGGIIDNSYLHSFWNESFAVYSDGLYHREWAGSNAGRLAFIPKGGANQSYDSLACAHSGAASGPIGSDLGYGKGSHVLFLLEKLIGTEAMVRSMRRFISDQPTEQTAEWSDFERAAIQENPGKHLEVFFADWIERPGHLDFKADASYSSGFVTLNYQPTKDPYRVPLEVLLAFPDGHQELKTFDVREAQQIKIHTGTKPDLISIDPYRFLIRHVRADEAPVTFEAQRRSMSVVVDRSHRDWAPGGSPLPSSLPSDLANVLIVGSPETLSGMLPLCEKAGFSVHQNHLTFGKTTIDLSKGGAVALIDLGRGRFCGISLGKSRIHPDLGTAKVAVFDDLGRFLDGVVEPKTQGSLTFRP